MNDLKRKSSSGPILILTLVILTGACLHLSLMVPSASWADSVSAPKTAAAPAASLRVPLHKPLPFIIRGKTDTPTRDTKNDLSLHRPAVLPSSHLPSVDVLVNQETFRLEVARTFEEQRLGLMYRESLPPRHGMIFPFSPPRAVNFWMKNCKIPLDMIFIQKGTVVHVVQGAPPCAQEPCPTFDSVYPIDTVIELSAGSAKQYNIIPGSRVRLVPPKQTVKTPVAPATEAPSDKPVGTSSEK